MELVDAAPTLEAPVGITTRLHQVNVERVGTFLNCMERVTLSCADEGINSVVRSAGRAGRLGACRGVGCLRYECMVQHRANQCGGELMRVPLRGECDNEMRFEFDLRVWYGRYVLPCLGNTLTTLKLPRIDLPEILLGCLAQARARVSVVYITNVVGESEDPGYLTSDLYGVGSGMQSPNQVVLPPPASGISALVIFASKDVNWRPVLQFTPNLRYLSMAYGPNDAAAFCEALSLVPQLTYLDLGLCFKGFLALTSILTENNFGSTSSSSMHGTSKCSISSSASCLSETFEFSSGRAVPVSARWPWKKSPTAIGVSSTAAASSPTATALSTNYLMRWRPALGRGRRCMSTGAERDISPVSAH